MFPRSHSKRNSPCSVTEKIGPGFESPPRINCFSSLSSLTSSWRIVFPLISRHLWKLFQQSLSVTAKGLNFWVKKGVNEGWRIIRWFFCCYDVRTLGWLVLIDRTCYFFCWQVLMIDQFLESNDWEKNRDVRTFGMLVLIGCTCNYSVDRSLWLIGFLSQ